MNIKLIKMKPIAPADRHIQRKTISGKIEYIDD